MSDINPVFLVQHSDFGHSLWADYPIEKFNHYKDGGSKTRILYPAAALEALQAENELLNTQVLCIDMANKKLRDENAELKEDLQFVERWANHHAAHLTISAKEALSVIQHYPSIEEITKSYKDGVIPNTRNPYAEIEALRKQVEDLTDILVCVTHHDGALQEYKPRWIGIVQNELSARQRLSAQKGTE